MRITKCILRFAAPFAKIESFSTYLFVGPHPDDIEIGAGATVNKLTEMGKSVHFLIASDGRYGTENTNLSEEALISERQREAAASAAALGVKSIRFLPFSDGGFYDQEELLNALSKAISEIRPDVIFAPDPEVHSEAHLDHLKVGSAVKHAACFAGNPGIMKKRGAAAHPVRMVAFYMTSRPNGYVKLKKRHLTCQLSAIFENHKTQFPEGSDAGKQIALYLKIRSLDMGLKRLTLHAEGFRISDSLHMHCLPESD
ncbi:MAG: PIG-L family deacetylase [Clostridia bacterium]|nr:PIG-L family deacetylase [Clostridia bacterium]